MLFSLLIINKLIDILKDSYEIGEMGKFLRGSTNKILPKPRILFGINTGKPFELGSGPDTFISGVFLTDSNFIKINKK